MLLSSCLRFVVACALLVALATQVRADSISFAVNWRSPYPSSLPIGDDGRVLFGRGFSGEVHGGDWFTIAANIKFIAVGPLVIGPSEGGYSLTLDLTDIDTSKTGTLTWTGQLQGRFDPSRNLGNVYTTFSQATPASQSIEVGAHKYTVSLDLDGPGRGPGGPVGLGVFTGHITAGPLEQAATPVQQAPEPSSLALLGLGAVGLAARRWRWRTQAA